MRFYVNLFQPDGLQVWWQPFSEWPTSSGEHQDRKDDLQVVLDLVTVGSYDGAKKWLMTSHCMNNHGSITVVRYSHGQVLTWWVIDMYS